MGVTNPAGVAIMPEYHKLLIGACEARIRNGTVLGVHPTMTVGADTLLALLTAPTSSGAVSEAEVERLCAAMQDGVGCTPWDNPSWDQDGTNGASRQGVRDAVKRILAAMSGPPYPSKKGG